MKMQWIKEQIEKGNYQLKLHAVERASTRGIDPLEVKEALLLNTLRFSLHAPVKYENQKHLTG